MDYSIQPLTPPLLDYHATSFSAGKMAFAWEEWTAEERQKAYVNWTAGRGLIGGDPRQRPGAYTLPAWGIDRPFFRALALEDSRGANKEALTAALASPSAIEIEIGYGRGDFLLDRARQYPDRLLVGYETKTKATRLCLERIARLQLTNLWLSDDDCRFNIPRIIPDGRVAMVHILFPDPWWKPQHKLKRLFSPPFVDLLAAKVQPGGLLHFKSDVEAYGEMVCALVEAHPAFSAQEAALATRIGAFAPTHREYWCQQHGRPVWAYYFERR
jgi:tRNA (guanine-N7-)-methyltransferase